MTSLKLEDRVRDPKPSMTLQHLGDAIGAAGKMYLEEAIAGRSPEVAELLKRYYAAGGFLP